MSSKSDIEWTDATWNPVRGCTKVSPGCKHCYAETFAERFRGVPGHTYEQGFDLRLVPDKLTEPLGWSRPRKVFVNSMSDLLHPRVPLMYVELVSQVIRLADWHEFQLLTKRASRLAEASKVVDLRARNLIVGVSVEDRRYGKPRIDELRRAQVGKRFLSIEPLLEDLGELDLTAIDWVIVGGESGPGARGMHADWVRSIWRQCVDQRVPFFFKQWGGVHKKTAGRELDGRTYDELPILEVRPPPSRASRRRRMAIIDELAAAPDVAHLTKLVPLRRVA